MAVDCDLCRMPAGKNEEDRRARQVEKGGIFRSFE